MAGPPICDECGNPMYYASSKHGKYFCARCNKYRRKSHQDKYHLTQKAAS